MSLATTPFEMEFPVLDREINGHRVVYLDSAATAQTPRCVVNALTDYYCKTRAPVHRGVYPLAVEATALYEGARDRIAEFVGWHSKGTVFTRNATEAINLVAYSWGRQNVKAGDTILITEMEHHANIVPWQVLAREVGARLVYVPIDDEGILRLDVLDQLLDEHKPKILAVTHVSNVLGTINPVAEIVERAHARGAAVLVDGSQAVPHFSVDVAALNPEFYVWTGHKTYGPTGIGVLHARTELLESMPPFLTGGHMISRVEMNDATWAEPPVKFEAGTAAIAEAIALGAAVDFLAGIGMDKVWDHCRELCEYADGRLRAVPGLHVVGSTDLSARGILFSFTVEGAHPHDVAEILGREGVCVRSGHHCAQVLTRRLGIPTSTRASFGIYNTTDDIDRLIDGLATVHRVLEL